MGFGLIFRVQGLRFRGFRAEDFRFACLFPTLSVGLLDFKVDVVLARLEADFSDQPPNIAAVPNHQVSLQCPPTKYPCSAQPPSIPAVPNGRVSLQCPTTMYPGSAERQSVPAVPNHHVSRQCPTTKYPCSAQSPSIPAVPNHQVSLECPTAEYQYSCSAFAVLQGRQLRGGRATLHFLCNNGFRVGMLEVSNLRCCAGFWLSWAQVCNALFAKITRHACFFLFCTESTAVSSPSNLWIRGSSWFAKECVRIK